MQARLFNRPVIVSRSVKHHVPSFGGRSPEKKADVIVGLRLIEVRESYCLFDFEFDQLERLTKKDMRDSNLRLLRSQLTSSVPAEETDT